MRACGWLEEGQEERHDFVYQNAVTKERQMKSKGA